MGRLWLVLILCGCALSHSSEQQSSFEQATKQEETTQTSVTTTTEEGGWTRRTWEFADGASQEAAAEAPAGGVPDVQAVEGRAGKEGLRPPGSGERPPQTANGRVGRDSYGVGGIIRYTEEEHGPKTQETRAEAKGASLASGAVKAEGKSEGSWSARLGPGFFSWIGIAAAVALAGFVSAKTGWPPFLLPLWKLLRLA